MWLVLHYHDNGDEVLVNMDNIVRISNREMATLPGEDVGVNHTILVSRVCKLHVKESIEEIYQMIRSKS